MGIPIEFKYYSRSLILKFLHSYHLNCGAAFVQYSGTVFKVFQFLFLIITSKRINFKTFHVKIIIQEHN